MSSIDTQVIRSEPHVEIGVLIEESAETLLAEWCRRAVAEQPTAKRVHSDVLRDHFSQLLRAIARALRQTGNQSARQLGEPALQHGEQRWDAGWSLKEVVRDYELMQIVVLEYLEKTLDRPLYLREMMAVGVFIDDAIAASLATYVAHRDEDLRRVERERAHAFEEANRRKDEFLAILGHELRNPLAPIQNSVRIIRALLPSPHPSVSTAIDVVERQTVQLVRLVDDILDLARIGKGQFELRRSHVDLTGVLEQAVQMSAPLVKARRHELVVSFPAERVELEADRERLVQIVCNLLNNAAKYTEPGGRISLSGERDDGGVIIRVRDNGIGVPPDMQSSIFDLFMQVEASRDHAQGGLGIGLTLVRRLVEQHGGTVTCGRAVNSSFACRWNRARSGTHPAGSSSSLSL
jgi:signal transduction histidine kinase